MTPADAPSPHLDGLTPEEYDDYVEARCAQGIANVLDMLAAGLDAMATDLGLTDHHEVLAWLVGRADERRRSTTTSTHLARADHRTARWELLAHLGAAMTCRTNVARAATALKEHDHA